MITLLLITFKYAVSPFNCVFYILWFYWINILIFYQILIMAYRPLRSQQSRNAADHCISPSPPPLRKPAPEPYPVAPIRHWTCTIHIAIDQARKTDIKSEHNESELKSNGNTQQRRRTELMLGLAIAFSCRDQRTKYAKRGKRWVRVRYGKDIERLSDHTQRAKTRQAPSRSYFLSRLQEERPKNSHSKP